MGPWSYGQAKGRGLRRPLSVAGSYYAPEVLLASSAATGASIHREVAVVNWPCGDGY
jgi:hypothetical protein